MFGRAARGRRTLSAAAGRALAVGLLLGALAPAAGGGPAPTAVDLTGSGAAQDAVGFGVTGALIEVTVWSASGIAAGPSTQAAGPGGSYAWSFAQVPDSSLLNLTLRAWLPWDPNVTASAVFDLSNASAPQDYPGVNLTLPFEANESIRLQAPAGEVAVPRGRNVTVPVDVVVSGNTTVAHSGPLLSAGSPALNASFVGTPGAESRQPGESFLYNLTLSAGGTASPGNTTVTLALPSSSGANLTVEIPVRIVLNRQVAVLAATTVPDPPREGEPAKVQVQVANRGADFAASTTVRVSAHNATDPDLYSNNTAVDLPPGGAPTNVTFDWTPPWSPTPVTVFASVFAPDDWDPSDDALNATFSVESTNRPPVVNLSSPADGARAAGNLTVTGTASDPEGSAVAVEFSVDGAAPFRTATGPAFGFVWDLVALPDGPHILNATAQDDRGNRATASATVTVLNRGPNAAPQVDVSTPAPGDVVGATAWVNGTASDERDELVAVFVSVDGGPEEAAEGLGNWSYPWNATAAGAGEHQLQVVAYDGIDRSAAATVNVTVNLSAPGGLAFLGVQVAPAIVQPNGDMTVTGTVRYDTGVLAQGAEVSGNLRGFAAVGAGVADARGGFSFTLPAPSSEGDFVLDLNARDGGLLGNATQDVRVARGSAPDLEVAPGSLVVTPDPPLSNRTVHHTVDIRNLGPVAANATLRVWDESGGAPVLIYEWDFTVTAQRQASFDHVYAAGLHNLTVRVEDVDPPDVDLSNNEIVVGVRVHSLPDFALISLTPSRNDPTAGQNISILAVIHNLGEAGGTVVFELWDGTPAADNSTLIYQETIAPLPGEEDRIVAPWTTTEGDHEINGILVQSNPAELNISNNRLTIRIQASGPPQDEPPVLLPGVGGAAAALALGAAAGSRRKGKRPRPERARPPRSRQAQAVAVALLAAGLAAALIPAPAGARLQDAGVLPGPLNGVCATCHTDPNGGADLNAFGRDYGTELNRSGGAVNLTRLGALDSDGDGFDNAQEWNGGYLPGDAASNPSTGVRYAGFTGQGITSAAVAGIVLVVVSLLGAWLGFFMLQRRNQRLAARAGAARTKGEEEEDEPPA